jgi:ribosome-associated protein
LALMNDRETIQISSRTSIPLQELDFRFSRSGGPGGQHANRSETRVELLFDVGRSPSLSDSQRERVMARLGHLIDKDGVLHLSSDSTRSQHQNREEVIARLEKLLRQALRPRKKRRPTRPSRAAREKRLEKKRRQSAKKRDRRWKE